MTIEALSVTAGIVFVAGWILIFAYRSEHVYVKLAAATAAERRWIPLTIVAVSAHTTLAEMVLTAPVIFGGPLVALSRTGITAGLVVFIGGLAWWAWARRSLGPFDRPLDTTVPPTELIVTGPFAVVRHPLALGTWLVALGPAIAVGILPTWITFAMVTLCLARRCRQDEEELVAVFGAAYTRYARRTHRLIPFVW